MRLNYKVKIKIKKKTNRFWSRAEVHFHAWKADLKYSRTEAK